MTWTVLSTTTIADETYVKGKRFVAAMMAKSSTASHLKLTIDDGVGTTSSDFHTGGGTAEYLAVARTLDAAATKIEIYAEVVTTNAAAYLGGVSAWFGDVAPKTFTSTRTAMNDHGRFWAPPRYKAGSADGFDAVVSGRIHTNYTAVGNVGAGEDDLMTYPLKGGSLDLDGKVIRVWAFGTHAANGNSKRIRVYFGSTLVGDVTSTENATTWFVDLKIFRTGATAQLTNIHMRTAGQIDLRITTPAETLSGNVTIKLTGEATSNDDISQKGWVIEVVG